MSNHINPEATSLKEYLEALYTCQKAHKGRQIFYRGHSKEEYKLEPSVFRTKNWRESEHLMLRQMLAENPQDFATDTSTFDKLVRAQHYGLPTRLLDVSTNPFVGLYFSVCSNPSHNGTVLLISSSNQRHKYFDSDTVSLMANLASLRRAEKEALLQFAKDNVSERTSVEMRVHEFQACPELDRLIQTIRAEKPHFRNEVDPFDLAFVVSVTPKKAHERIRAQEGQFLLFGMNENDSGQHLEYLKVSQIEVPASAKEGIRDELAQVGVSKRTLFPEIENSATQIKQRYS